MLTIERMMEEIENAIIFMDGKLNDGVWSTYEEREMLETMNALSEARKRLAFQQYIDDGNACLVDGQWSTQESMWADRFETKDELFKHFKREYHGTL
jgi:hypothetical protein